MRVSETTGVLGVIIVRMLGDVLHFFFLAVILLSCYTVLFLKLFGYQYANYQNIPDTMVALAGAALGNFDFFTERTEGGGVLQVTGNMLLFSFLLLSTVVLVNLLIAMMSRTYSETYEQSAIGVWRLQFAHLVRQYDYDILPPPLNLLWFVARLMSYFFIISLYQLSKVSSTAKTILWSRFGQFISTMCGDDLASEFEMIDERDVAKTWKFFRLAFALSYDKFEEDEDHSSDPMLLAQYLRSKEVEEFEVPVEFNHDYADDNPIQPYNNSVTTRRKAARAQIDQQLRRSESKTTQL